MEENKNNSSFPMIISDGFGFIFLLGGHLYSATVLFQSILFTNILTPQSWAICA